MRRGHSSFTGYAETQNMIPRLKAVGNTVITNITEGGEGGEAHAMFGYTYEVPCTSDIAPLDPGLADFGIGYNFYWQFIIPVKTFVDTMLFVIAPNFRPINENPTKFALYDMNTSDDSWPLVVETEGIVVTQFDLGTRVLALNERVTLEPGIYAMAHSAPCYNVYCIRASRFTYRFVNAIFTPSLNKYGAIFLDVGLVQFPDPLDNTRAVVDPNFFEERVPFTYWWDSQQFTLAL